MTGTRRPVVFAQDADGIARAGAILREGGLVAVPTETVYGLAARADCDRAVAGIYAAKGRPDFNPLIVHVPDIAAVEAVADLDERGRRLAAAFWPGPLTLVLPRRPSAGLAAAVSAGLPTVAVRCPAHPVMRAVLAAADVPLAAPSANASGGISPTRAEHVCDSLDGRIDAVVDGGPCAAGLESTIVALRENGGWSVLRPGPISSEMIANVLGAAETDEGPAGIEAPGQLIRHYAPGKPVRMDAVHAEADEFHVGFGPVKGAFSLSPSGDLQEAAARLYDALHAAARSDRARIAIAPVPHEGIGVAINDRLRRAAA